MKSPKKPFVLSVIGPKAYKLLGNLMFQKKDRQSVGFVAYGNTNSIPANWTGYENFW